VRINNDLNFAARCLISPNRSDAIRYLVGEGIKATTVAPKSKRKKAPRP
jgi:hypothetical protein